ncbi:sensor histidine kinase [Sphingobium vermicomposti]|uniref:Signal transduction histidine kinase n=1 Tax=Sphingobium vermicomposti TaxID=529005 RepID=A0A846M5N6_9SPHN|nr:histidine kinase [Sphingobium vermicomposti]NIJ16040.1 signal transduction histidine kinase [Sphingobium vermicomposti]
MATRKLSGFVPIQPPGGIWRSLRERLRVSPSPERLISTGRLVAVLFAALAIFLDPTRPAGFLNEAHYLLAVYLAFSLSLVIAPPSWPFGSSLHLISHGVDVLALAALVYLTDELSSPFFPFLPFILLATTLRWGILGAVIGALAMEALLLAIGWGDLWDGDSELNVFIMRSAYFLVAAAMLGYFGACRASNSKRFAQLASWSFAPATTDAQVWLTDLLGHASGLLRAERLVLIWQDKKGASGSVALWGPEGLRYSAIEDPSFWRTHAASLVQNPLSRKKEVAQLQAIGAALQWPNLIIDAAMVRSAHFAGATAVGRLYVVDANNRHEDAQHLTQITALRIGHELERLALIRAVADKARDQERVRLTRDLHDSVLQELTAASLKLKAARAAMPEEAREPLNGVSHIMAEQQRRIRLFVENSRTRESLPLRDLSLLLAERADELSDQWGCDIALSVQPPDMEAPGSLHRELTQLLNEATANAVRHGGATRLAVELQQQDKGLCLTIVDNGCGRVPSADDEPTWPRSLRARVRDMGGRLAITRYAPGLAMKIEVPLP